MGLITPSGKVKDQKNQGAYKNVGFLDNLFSNLSNEQLKKIALSPPSPPPGAGNNPKPNVPDQGQLNSAMDSGNMRGNNLPKNPEMAQPQNPMQSGKSIPPNGNAKNNPAGQSGQQGAISPFLSPVNNPDQTQDKQLLDEKMRLRRAAGGGFAINLNRGTDGTFDLTLTPPPGYSVGDPDQFVQSLLHSVDGEAEEIGDPDQKTGTMRIRYKSRNIGPSKVQKSGK